MRTRLSVLVVVVSLLLPAGARASGHWFSMAATPSVNTGLSQLWGGSISAEKALPNKSQFNGFIDIGKHAGAHEDSTLSQFSLLAGLRGAFPLIRKKDGHYALQPYAHVLGGFLLTKEKGVDLSDKAPALGGGIGVDYLFSDYGGLRAQIDHVTFWRDRGGHDQFVRFSVGITYRFEHDAH